MQELQEISSNPDRQQPHSINVAANELINSKLELLNKKIALINWLMNG